MAEIAVDKIRKRRGNMLDSLIIAFSMYSRIPMPRIEWKEKSMRYAMCFFPLVGAVIGLSFVAVFWCLHRLRIGKICSTAILTALPFLISGGIHMDGFIDTIDARRSYGDREKKLAILKDPHTGAFAILYTVIYFLILYGCYSELTEELIWSAAIGFVLSRAFSALALVTFPKAKKEGTLAAFSEAAKHKAVCFTMLGVILAVFLLGSLGFRWRFFLAFFIGGSWFGYYYWFSKREFGGITGDLAGYFLQMYELIWTAVLIGSSYLF